MWQAMRYARVQLNTEQHSLIEAYPPLPYKAKGGVGAPHGVSTEFWTLNIRSLAGAPIVVSEPASLCVGSTEHPRHFVTHRDNGKSLL